MDPGIPVLARDAPLQLAEVVRHHAGEEVEGTHELTDEPHTRRPRESRPDPIDAGVADVPLEDVCLDLAGLGADIHAITSRSMGHRFCRVSHRGANRDPPGAGRCDRLSISVGA